MSLCRPGRCFQVLHSPGRRARDRRASGRGYAPPTARIPTRGPDNRPIEALQPQAQMPRRGLRFLSYLLRRRRRKAMNRPQHDGAPTTARDDVTAGVR